MHGSRPSERPNIHPYLIRIVVSEVCSGADIFIHDAISTQNENLSSGNGQVDGGRGELWVAAALINREIFVQILLVKSINKFCAHTDADYGMVLRKIANASHQHLRDDEFLWCTLHVHRTRHAIGSAHVHLEHTSALIEGKKPIFKEQKMNHLCALGGGDGRDEAEDSVVDDNVLLIC